MQTRSLNKHSQKEIFLQRILLLTFYLVVTTGATEARSGVKLGQRARTAPPANSRNTIIDVWKESKGSARSTVNLETMSALSTSSNHPAGSAGPNATTRDAGISAQVTQLTPKRLSETDKNMSQPHNVLSVFSSTFDREWHHGSINWSIITSCPLTVTQGLQKNMFSGTTSYM